MRYLIEGGEIFGLVRYLIRTDRKCVACKDVFGMILKYVWYHLGIILAYVWYHFGIMLAVLWNHLGIV